MDDLIGEFITETSESLAVLDLELVKLERNPGDQRVLGNIFRLVHTIKGTCGFLGLPRLESVAHAGENVLGKIRDGEIIVTQEAISIVLEGIDRIKTLIEHLAEKAVEPEGEDGDLIRRLNAFAETNGKAAPATATELLPGDIFLPDELHTVSSTGAATLDALERAFAGASSTLEGGMDFTRAPDTFLMSESQPPVAVPEKLQAAPAISEQAKEKAIEQGLDTDGGNPVQQSIRVGLDVLENLMQMVGELVLTRNQLLQVARHRDDQALKAPLQQLSRITSGLQESVMKTRMQPIGNAWSKFPRLIRDLGHELGKKIELKMVGEATELDRQLLEMMKDPLTHMVRNSCDHGLETPNERIAAGKSATGTVTLSACHEGGHIAIRIGDDGRGLNIGRIRQKIIEKNLAATADLAQMTDEQVMQYIFKAGFSTAEKITSVSGRGVGMDVVRTNIEKIGGTVSLTSAAGKGSTFHITIPLTLAIVSVLIVESAGRKFAIPQTAVVELVSIGADSDYRVETINAAAVLRLRDRLVPLIRLRDVLRLPDSGTSPDRYVAIIRAGANDFGIVIDDIHDIEEIVARPLSRLLGGLGVYAGNTILGDGDIIMILDGNGLARVVGERDSEAGGKRPVVTRAIQEKIANFLVFHAGFGAPKAVPLELVSRLEVIGADAVELCGRDQVVQYRGDLMRLKCLPGNTIPQSGAFDVIVFTYDNRAIGLVVDAIVDILEAPLAIKISGPEEYYLGSLIIAGKTTDVVDVGYLLKDLAADLGRMQGDHAAAGAGQRILLVEDSIFFSRLIAPFLAHAGYAVTSAASGAEALAHIAGANVPFDAVVTDIEMPGMDGFELAARLRDGGRYSGVPILAFTSTVNEAFRERSREVGMNGIVLKTDRESLLAALEHHLHHAGEIA